MKRLPLLLIGLLVILTAVAGCTRTAFVQVHLTDSFPPGIAHLYLQVEKIELVPVNSENTEGNHVMLFEGPTQEIDVLATRTDPMAITGNIAVPAGTYSEIRLVIVDQNSRMVIEDEAGNVKEEIPIKIPSGTSSGLKLKLRDTDGGEGVTVEGPCSITIDFDAWKSVVNNNGWKLNPTARAVMTQTTGKITGTVLDQEAGTAIAGAAVSVKDKDGVEIATTATDENGFFTVNAIPATEYAGTYTVTVTFDGYQTWETTGVTVEAGKATNFEKIELLK